MSGFCILLMRFSNRGMFHLASVINVTTLTRHIFIFLPPCPFHVRGYQGNAASPGGTRHKALFTGLFEGDGGPFPLGEHGGKSPRCGCVGAINIHTKYMEEHLRCEESRVYIRWL